MTNKEVAEKQYSLLEIKDLLAQATESSRKLLTKKDISVEYAPSVRPTQILSDEETLSSVIDSLFTNAVKSAGTGDRIVIEMDTIHGKRHNDISDFLKVGVRVCGIGVSKDMINSVLDRFHQIGELLKVNPAKNHNMAVSSLKDRIKSLGGNVWVKSKLDQGLTYFFTVPLVKDAQEQGSVDKSRVNIVDEKTEVRKDLTGLTD